MYDYEDTTSLSEVDFLVEIQARKVYQFISDNAEFETKKGHTLQGKESVKWKESRLTILGCLQTVCIVHEETGRDRLRIESKFGSRITSHFVDDKSSESFCVTTKKGSNVELNIKKVKDIIERKEIAKEEGKCF